MKKTVFITGTSSGFGKLTANKFHAEGWNVIATMRSPERETELTQLDNVLVTALDVTDKQSIEEAVALGLARFGTIDVLINNAGHALNGPLEATSSDAMRRQFDTNFFGLIDVTKAVLPTMRKHRKGVVINFSSMGGRVAFPITSLYHASKYAVEGLTESLQYELNPLGIKLKLIEPGAYNTNLLVSNEFAGVDDDSDYKPILDATFAAFAQMGDAQQDPQEVADATFLAATDDTETLRYPVGQDTLQTFAAREQMDDVEFKTMIAGACGL
ncbi:SDR family oxidoreductase [Psychrobium sp. MM17-31]|uniref:SDR family oxidoreductase n=1 Tax=Psychrobium sp. MM17-31 TaxID=2917758 RepID=UPI001EF4A0D5|nr:SDR family oxidoreductase [Psychrobium sp. MM17-31]MCG7532658.1 SDR family oxidoreductase [Psychrobium sp. MM17-31]